VDEKQTEEDRLEDEEAAEQARFDARMEIFRKYDLTLRHAVYLDKHLSNYLLEHLRELNKMFGDNHNVDIFPEEDIIRAQYQLMRGTKMTDFVCDLKKELDGEDSIDLAELEEEKESVHNQCAQFIEETSDVLEFLQSSQADSLRQNNLLNIKTLSEGNHEKVFEMCSPFFELAWGSGAQPDLPFLQTPEQTRHSRVVNVQSANNNGPVTYKNTRWNARALILASSDTPGDEIRAGDGRTIEYNGTIEEHWIKVEAVPKHANSASNSQEKVYGWMPSIIWAWLLEDDTYVMQFEEGSRWDWIESHEVRRSWKVGTEMSIAKQFITDKPDDKTWEDTFAEELATERRSGAKSKDSMPEEKSNYHYGRGGLNLNTPVKRRANREKVNSPLQILKIQSHGSGDPMLDQLTIGTQSKRFTCKMQRNDERIRSREVP